MLQVARCSYLSETSYRRLGPTTPFCGMVTLHVLSGERQARQATCNKCSFRATMLNASGRLSPVNQFFILTCSVTLTLGWHHTSSIAVNALSALVILASRLLNLVLSQHRACTCYGEPCNLTVQHQSSDAEAGLVSRTRSSFHAPSSLSL